MYTYVKEFEKLGFGLFVHFGLYSMVEKGEWYLHYYPDARERYEKLPQKFKVAKNWARELAKKAKHAGCKYIALTTRHHDGFSLYDTKGLSTYDAPHSACKRDLVAEFVEACRNEGLVPFFYHTLIDWHVPEFKTDFPAYIDYLVKSIEILCTNYGKIGGIWFDGTWNDPDADWQEDRLYGTVRRLQPTAMIINNTGVNALGKKGHPMLDSVTFERGKTGRTKESDRPRAGEMCQVFGGFWGYAKNDYSYKPLACLIQNLLDCRYHNCNFLLNVGPKGNGLLPSLDKAYLEAIGNWIAHTGDLIYRAKAASIEAENADVLTDGEYYYAIVKNPEPYAMSLPKGDRRIVKIMVEQPIREAIWLEEDLPIEVSDNSFSVKNSNYGENWPAHIARFKI